MATVNFSVPDEVKEAFNFIGVRPAAILADRRALAQVGNGVGLLGYASGLGKKMPFGG